MTFVAIARCLAQAFVLFRVVARGEPIRGANQDSEAARRVQAMDGLHLSITDTRIFQHDHLKVSVSCKKVRQISGYSYIKLSVHPEI